MFFKDSRDSLNKSPKMDSGGNILPQMGTKKTAQLD